VEAFGSYKTSVHMCRPHSTASYGTAVVQCIAIAAACAWDHGLYWKVVWAYCSFDANRCS